MNKVSVIQGQFSQNRTNLALLRSGSVVTGRVLSKNGSSSYTLSLAGQKIEVHSQTNLKEGLVFRAKVSLSGNQVQLSLLQEANAQNQKPVINFSAEPQNLSPELSNFLSSLGFEPNAESFKILQFMQQIGMKIDVQAAKKALLLSKKNSDSDSEYSQVSLLLDEKGLAPDSEKIAAVLGQNGRNRNDSGGSKDRNSEQKTKSPSLDSFSTDNLKKAVKKFFSQVDHASLENKSGILTAFNSILSSSPDNIPLRHWIILPFEWNYASYTGDIRLLFDSELKALEKTLVNLKNESQKLVFVLYYKNNQLDFVKFGCEPASAQNPFSGAKILQSLMPGNVPVEEADFDSLHGFCASDETISTLNGIA